MAPDGDSGWAPLDAGPAPVAAAPAPPASVLGVGGGGPPGGPVPMGPLAFADILDGAFTLYRANARTLVTLSAAVILPVELVTAWLGRAVGGGIVADGLPSSRFSITSSTSGSSIVVAVVSSALVLTLLAGAVARVASASYFGGALGPGAALGAVLRRWPALVAAWVLVHVLEALGAIVAFLPGLLAMALFVAVTPAVVVEGLGPVAAMRRSGRLARSRLFPTLGVALGSALVVGALDMALGWLPLVLGAVAGPWGWALRAAAGTITGLVTAPYVTLVATLVYLDARCRSEGMDVAVLASRLRSRG